jgi:hypothetical protein
MLRTNSEDLMKLGQNNMDHIGAIWELRLAVRRENGTRGLVKVL